MDFNQWWREFGRFTPPLDKITDIQLLESFKCFADKCWNAAESESADEIRRLNWELDQS